jgi:hypothetical protein
VILGKWPQSCRSSGNCLLLSTFIRQGAASPGKSESLRFRAPQYFGGKSEARELAHSKSAFKTQSAPGLADAAMRKLRDRLSMKARTLFF